MKIFILLLLPSVTLAATIPPMPFPVFLKAGFSSVLEFDDIPTRVVLGDAQNFQIEKLDHSLVVRTLAPYDAGNMFVYFKDKEPRLFILKASEDAEPTYYRKFESPVAPKQELKTTTSQKSFNVNERGVRVLLSSFDHKKDYLTVEIEVAADSKEPVKPNWDLVRLSFNGSAVAPNKLWAERQDVQRDSRVKARLIFFKPNVPRNQKEAFLIVPVQGQSMAFKLKLNRGAG